MTKTYISCGLDIRSSRSGKTLRPILNLLQVVGHQTQRQTLALPWTFKSMPEALDFIEVEGRELGPESDLSLCADYTDNELEECFKTKAVLPIKVFHPNVESIGDKKTGTVVGYHIDYKTGINRSGKRVGKPSLLTVMSIIDENNRCDHVVVQKRHIDPKEVDDIQAFVNDAWWAAFTQFPVGGTAQIEVTPAGSRAKYTLRSYTKEERPDLPSLLVSALESLLAQPQPTKSRMGKEVR